MFERPGAALLGKFVAAERNRVAAKALRMRIFKEES